MKKLTTITLTAIALITLTACGNHKEEPQVETQPTQILKVNNDTAVEKNVTESSEVEETLPTTEYVEQQEETTPSTNTTVVNNIAQYVKTLHKRDGENVTTSLRSLHSEYGLGCDQIFVIDNETNERTRSDKYFCSGDVVTCEEVQYTDASCTEIVSVTLFYNHSEHE